MRIRVKAHRQRQQLRRDIKPWHAWHRPDSQTNRPVACVRLVPTGWRNHVQHGSFTAFWSKLLSLLSWICTHLWGDCRSAGYICNDYPSFAKHMKHMRGIIGKLQTPDNQSRAKSHNGHLPNLCYTVLEFDAWTSQSLYQFCWGFCCQNADYNYNLSSLVYSRHFKFSHNSRLFG